MTLTITLGVLLVLATFALYQLFQRREFERVAMDECRERLLLEIDSYKARARTIQEALDAVGGIGKRIAECREITETLQQHAPAVFRKEPALIYWIEATDEFLVNLHVAAGSDSRHERIANSRSEAIYRQVRAGVGIPLSPGQLANLS